MKLLEEYGWDPVGTINPNPAGSWDGTYLAKRGQSVGAKDAAAMGKALESALPNIAASEASPGDSPEANPQDPRSVLSQALRKTDPEEVLRGSARERLRAFVEFAKAGEFSIGG